MPFTIGISNFEIQYSRLDRINTMTELTKFETSIQSRPLPARAPKSQRLNPASFCHPVNPVKINQPNRDTSPTRPQHSLKQNTTFPALPASLASSFP